MDRVRTGISLEVLEALETNRVVILEGPVGSGKSSVASAVAESAREGAVRRLFPAAAEKNSRYAAMAHLITDPASAHLELLSLATSNDSLLVVVDDFQHLDEGSARLLLWSIDQAPVKLLISCNNLEAIPLLAETRFEASTKVLQLPALAPSQIKTILEYVWRRPAQAWEVVSTARFAGANLGAVRVFAEFALENFPEAQTPEAWLDCLLNPNELSHTVLHGYMRNLRENHVPEIFDALQVLAVAGPCTTRDAVALVDTRVLVELSALGLISDPTQNTLVQLSHGLLDLSIRLSMDADHVRIIYETKVCELRGDQFLQTPPAHLGWWQEMGLEVPAANLHSGARQALLSGQPAAALRLLSGDESVVATWLAAEASILTGDSAKARTFTDMALSHGQSPDQLGATEALVCVGAGYWPAHAARFMEVGGLDAAATAVYLSTQGAHAEGVELAASLERNTDQQMWQNVHALAALAEALEGKALQARLRIETLGPVSPDASAITSQNVAEARRAVEFLSGDWNSLRESTLGGYALHAVTDRSGSTSDICHLLGEPSGAKPYPINYEAPAPAGYVRMRELARAVACAPKDPLQALEQVTAYRREHKGTLPVALKLFSLGWEVKLHLESGETIPAGKLEKLVLTASKCEGLMAQLLGLLASGLIEESDSKLAAVEVLARRYGMGEWLPVLPRRFARSVDLLSRREQEIARRAALGVRNTDIAIDLDLSVRTVEKHLGNIYRKLELGGRDELAEALS